MGTRHQHGYIFRKGSCWYVRFYDYVQTEGRIVRRQVCRQVVPYCDRYRSKRDVREVVEDILKSVNASGWTPDSVLSLGQFIEHHYLLDAEQQKRPSTAKGYRDIWERHLRGRAGEIRLRDFRPADGERLMQDIAKSSGFRLSRTTLKHIKSLLSGVFTYARRQGLLQTANPMQGVSIPHGSEPLDTYAYSLEEITSMLAVLAGRARAVVATAAFTGLRRSEIRGLRWEDYTPPGDGQFGELCVGRSVWKQHVHATKTRMSKACVPVIPALASILEEHRASVGNPRSGYIFVGVRFRRPLDVDGFAKDHIVPVLTAHNQAWRWWHPFRRGLATNLYRLGVSDKVIQSILRHSSTATTREIYIKSVGIDSIAAMQRLETAIKTPRPN